MSNLNPVLNLREGDFLLCQREILPKKEEYGEFKQLEWDNLKQQAKLWRDIKIPITDVNYAFRLVHLSVADCKNAHEIPPECPKIN